MKAKVFTLLLAVLLLGSTAMGESVISDGFELGIGSQSVSLLKYLGEDAEVIIPDNYAGLPLTTVGDKAFYEMEHIIDVDLPDTVVEIGDKAFYGCSGLEFIYIPSSVMHIGYDAFANYDNLMLNFEDGSYAKQYAMALDLEYQFYEKEGSNGLSQIYGEPIYTEPVIEDESLDLYESVDVIDTYPETTENQLQTTAP